MCARYSRKACPQFPNGLSKSNLHDWYEMKVLVACLVGVVDIAVGDGGEKKKFQNLRRSFDNGGARNTSSREMMQEPLLVLCGPGGDGEPRKTLLIRGPC